MERRMILEVLSAADNNRTRAAEQLGISRRSLYSKLRKYDIK
jgi:transcriptional regulator with PAS, ATPase and Fis domain